MGCILHIWSQHGRRWIVQTTQIGPSVGGVCVWYGCMRLVWDLGVNGWVWM
jgi:hypothetical protein